jgi:hypothetical protein
MRFQFPTSSRHVEALLDQSLAETFPASDPIAPAHRARRDAARLGRTSRASRDWGERWQRLLPALTFVAVATLTWMLVRRTGTRRW